MSEEKKKTPLKEREGWKKFKSIFPKVASGVLSAVGTVIPAAGAVGDIIDGMVNKGEVSNEEASVAKQYLLEHETEIFKLEVEDRKSARELYKEDSSLQKTFAITFLVGYLVLTVFLIAAMFGFTVTLDSWEVSLVSAIWGGFTTKVSTITDFLFGSSNGSKKKTDQLNRILAN